MSNNDPYFMSICKVRAQYRPDLVLQKTGITSIAGFFPTAVDGQNELSKLKDIVKLNLGRALLPGTHTMLFMRFIANDGQENLLWSLSYDTDKVKAKYGELSVTAAGSNEAVMQELIKRMQALKTSPGTIQFTLSATLSFQTSLWLQHVSFSPSCRAGKNAEPHACSKLAVAHGDADAQSQHH